MFDTDYSFRGKHADMVNELTAPFDDRGNKLFIRNLDVYLVAPIVGFLYRRKSELDSNGRSTNILFAAMSKETTTLWFNYRLIMLLDENNEPDFNTRINQAFRNYGTEKAKADEIHYESYVLGGIEVLYEKLMHNISNAEDYLKNTFEFMCEFENLYGQDSNDIFNLVELVKG